MQLPWIRRARSSRNDTPSETEAAPQQVVHRSPGFEALISGLKTGSICRILDLGRAVPENIEFLGAFGHRFQIVDAFRNGPDPLVAARALDRLRTRFEGAFDLVLLWDFLNYLSAEDGAALVASIAPLCRPEARCLALVAASDSMPASPNTYRVVDGKHLVYDRAICEETGAPHMPPAAVERVFAGFTIEHAFVLRNGFREFVAVRNPQEIP